MPSRASILTLASEPVVRARIGNRFPPVGYEIKEENEGHVRDLTTCFSWSYSILIQVKRACTWTRVGFAADFMAVPTNFTSLTPDPKTYRITPRPRLVFVAFPRADRSLEREENWERLSIPLVPLDGYQQRAARLQTYQRHYATGILTIFIRFDLLPTPPNSTLFCFPSFSFSSL